MGRRIYDHDQLRREILDNLRHGGWEIESQERDRVVTWKPHDHLVKSLTYDVITYECEGETCVDFITYHEKDFVLFEELTLKGKSIALAYASDMLNKTIFDTLNEPESDIYFALEISVGVWHLDPDVDEGMSRNVIARVSVW